MLFPADTAGSGASNRELLRSTELADILFSTAWRQKCIKLLSLQSSSGLKICRKDKPTAPLRLYDVRQSPSQRFTTGNRAILKTLSSPNSPDLESTARGKVDPRA